MADHFLGGRPTKAREEYPPLTFVNLLRFTDLQRYSVFLLVNFCCFVNPAPENNFLQLSNLML